MSNVNQNFLPIRLIGADMHFGGTKVDNYNFTERIPLKSMIVGLLGNALGYDRDANHGELIALADRLEYAVRIDRVGNVEREFQTVDIDTAKDDSYGQIKIDKKGRKIVSDKHLKYSTYLVDAAYLVVISLDDVADDMGVSLETLNLALESPARPLFIGQKKHMPSVRIGGLPIVQGASFEDVLSRFPQLRRKSGDTENPTKEFECWFPMLSESDFDNLTALDQIVEFCDDYDPMNRCHGGQRFMKCKRVKLSDSLIDVGVSNFCAKPKSIMIELSKRVDKPKRVPLDRLDEKVLDKLLQQEKEIEKMEINGKEIHEITLQVKIQQMKDLALMHRNSQSTLGVDDTDQSYEYHVLMSCLFGLMAPKNFCIKPISEDVSLMQFYSVQSLEKLQQIAQEKNEKHLINKASLFAVDWAASKETKDFGNWSENQEIEIEITINPIRLAEGVQRDTYESHQTHIALLEARNDEKNAERIAHLKSLTKEQVYELWLKEKLEKVGCVKVEFVELLEHQMQKVMRKNHKCRRNTTFEQPIATFKSRIKVVKPEEMNSFLLDGIGKQKGFGKGMPQLKKV